MIIQVLNWAFDTGNVGVECVDDLGCLDHIVLSLLIIYGAPLKNESAELLRSWNAESNDLI